MAQLELELELELAQHGTATSCRVVSSRVASSRAACWCRPGMVWKCTGNGLVLSVVRWISRINGRSSDE